MAPSRNSRPRRSYGLRQPVRLAAGFVERKSLRSRSVPREGFGGTISAAYSGLTMISVLDSTKPFAAPPPAARERVARHRHGDQPDAGNHDNSSFIVGPVLPMWCRHDSAEFMTDREKNRFSARAARYARVGANVGGVAARYAGRRMIGGDARPGRRSGGARGRARQSQGAADEGRPIDGDHPRSVAARICRRIAEAAERSAADGLGLRQAPHGRGTRARLADEIRELRASSGRGRFARPGASRPFARRRASSPANCNIPTCSRRSRRTCGSCNGCSRSAAASTARSTLREIGKEIGARVREELDYRREAKHVALYRRDARRTSKSCACRARGRNSRPAAC